MGEGKGVQRWEPLGSHVSRWGVPMTARGNGKHGKMSNPDSLYMCGCQQQEQTLVKR